VNAEERGKIQSFLIFRRLTRREGEPPAGNIILQ
jgi:hypothetical protein